MNGKIIIIDEVISWQDNNYVKFILWYFFFDWFAIEIDQIKILLWTVIEIKINRE